MIKSVFDWSNSWIVRCLTIISYSYDQSYKPTIYRRFIFVGREKNEHETIQHNTKQWYRNAFSGPKQ